MKIDQVLKGRLKWYEKSTKRKVNYKRSLRLWALKWNYYNLHSGNFWIVTLWIRNRVDAKYGYIYIQNLTLIYIYIYISFVLFFCFVFFLLLLLLFFFCFFFLWRNKIQPSSLPWILYSRWQPPSHVFSVALDFALTYLYDACSVSNIPRGALGTRVNLDTCRHANSIWKWILVGVEIFESGKK